MSKARTLTALAAVALGAGAIGAAYRRDMRAARDRLSGASRMVSTELESVELAEAGTGPPVLVVHGSAGGFDQALSLGRAMVGDGFRILAPSRFGYLGTPMPAKPSHAAEADALARLLDALDVRRAVVIGVSAGAQPATQFALRHPERCQALVLISPALYLPPPPGSPLPSGPPPFVLDHVLASDFVVWSVVRLVPNLLVRVAGVPRSLVSKVPPEQRRELAAGFFPASSRHVGLAYDMRTTTPIAPDLPIENLHMPVLLIAADDDPYKTAEVIRYSAPRIPDAKTFLVESGGHVLIGQTDRIRAEVRRFISRSIPGRGS